MDFELSRAAAWITVGRIRAHAILLAVCVWSVIALDFATPDLMDRVGNIKFQDFLPLYVSGIMVRQGQPEQLFDPAIAIGRMHDIVAYDSTRVLLPYLYGPQVGWFFSPFSRFSFATAAWLWTAASISLYLLCCYVTWAACPTLRPYRGLVLLLAIAFPPFFHCVVRGQISSLILVCFLAAFLAFRAGHNVSAGLALGLLVFKPQVLLAIPLVLLASGAWKSLAGVAIGALGQLGSAWWYFGNSVMRSYIHTMWNIPHMVQVIEPGQAHAQMHSLRSFWSLLVPSPSFSFGLYLLSSLGILGLAILSWKRSGPLQVRFSALLMASILVNPHLLVYDLLILTLPLLLMADWARGSLSGSDSHKVSVLLYLAYLLPLLGPVTLRTRLQLSVLVFAALQYMFFVILKRQQPMVQELQASSG